MIVQVAHVIYRALVYISHGVGEYMGRYELLGQELASNGILAFGHDHGGCGIVSKQKVALSDLFL